MDFSKQNIYSRHFNEKSFWEKIKNYGSTAGRKVVEPALIMYYCLKDKDTPLKIKLIIIGALGYFILPTDAIPDLSPLIGFSDDLGALLTAYEMAKAYTKPEHREKAEEQLSKWF
jgi:uncharacterized membrane protein YkvA (DUF1232 family)